MIPEVTKTMLNKIIINVWIEKRTSNIIWSRDRASISIQQLRISGFYNAFSSIEMACHFKTGSFRPCPLGPLCSSRLFRSLRSFRSFKSFMSFRSLSPLGPFGPLCPSRLFRSLRSFRSFKSFMSFRSFLSP
jgi:hypothetical protein